MLMVAVLVVCDVANEVSQRFFSSLNYYFFLRGKAEEGTGKRKSSRVSGGNSGPECCNEIRVELPEDL